MSKLPLRRTRKYRNERCQVHPYMREKFYRTYQRTMGKSYFLRQVKWRENYYQVKVPVEPGVGGGGGRGGVGYSGFQVTGMIEWGQNSKHKKKSLRLQTKPKKFPNEFPESRKGYNTKKNQRQPGYAGTTTIPRIFRLFWISKQIPT